MAEGAGTVHPSAAALGLGGCRHLTLPCYARSSRPRPPPQPHPAATTARGATLCQQRRPRCQQQRSGWRGRRARPCTLQLGAMLNRCAWAKANFCIGSPFAVPAASSSVGPSGAYRPQPSAVFWGDGQASCFGATAKCCVWGPQPGVVYRGNGQVLCFGASTEVRRGYGQQASFYALDGARVCDSMADRGVVEAGPAAAKSCSQHMYARSQPANAPGPKPTGVVGAWPNRAS